MGKVVGIDLGTTNSVVAHYEGRRPKVLTLSAGRQMMRSAVSLRESRSGGEPQTLVGDPAISYWEYAPQDTIVSIKRLMGRVFDDTEVQKVREDYSYQIGAPSDGSRDSVRVLMGGSEYSPVDISAIILRQLKEDAQKRLTDEVTHAVITVPAYFNQAQNAATRLAGQRAGLKVIRLLDEPTAAAVAYGQQIEGLEDSQAGAPETLLVYDLGGGTFDISILVWSGNTYTTVGIEGDMWLGGDNFDHVVMAWARDQIRRETGIQIDPEEERWKTFMVGLLQRVQQAKVMLSGSPSADIVVPNSLRDENGVPIPLFLELTRDQYESMIEPLVDRADSLIDKALQNTDLVEGDIDHVLLAGNATLTPLVQRKVAERFGRDKIVHAQNPKYVVAEGASVVARMLVGRTICPNPDCQHVNEEDADRCAKCGQSLEVTGKKCWSCGTVNEEDAERCISCGVLLREKEEEPVYLVAERDYGVQMMDGSVAAFVKKGDPIPTMDATPRQFVTREGNQRMMLLRVWGGEDLQSCRIDENGGNDDQDLELQGEAVVFLPPRLVEGTQVRVSLSLDRDRVFVPEAQLVNGDDLRCVVIKDEGSQAVDALYRLDTELHGLQMGGLSDDQESQAEQLRNQVVGALEGRHETGDEIGALEDFLSGLSAGPVQDVESQAEMLLAFVGDLTQNYSWGLTAQHTHQLTQRAAQVTESLQLYQADKSVENRRRLESAVRALDGATDQEQLQSEDAPLSRDMVLMLGIRSAIWTRIRPRNSQQADELIQEHEEIRKGFDAGESSARAQLMLFSIKVRAVIEELPPPPMRTCPVCGAEVQPGELQCPNGHIQILPDVDKSHSWSEFGA